MAISVCYWANYANEISATAEHLSMNACPTSYVYLARWTTLRKQAATSLSLFTNKFIVGEQWS